MASLLSAVVLLAAFSSGLCVEKAALQRAGVAFNDRPYRSLLTVTNGESFGNWTWTEMCPDKFFAVGFSIRVKTPALSCIKDILFDVKLLMQGIKKLLILL